MSRLFKRLNRNEKGQAALESAIILIAFVVVASVFAFTILSAGSATTEKGEEAIYAGLEGVQSSLSMRGAVVAEGSSDAVTTVRLTLAVVAGNEPVDTSNLVFSYRDGSQYVSDVEVTAADDFTWITSNEDAGSEDALLEEGEVLEVALDLSGLDPALIKNTEFTIEVKPTTGGILTVNRTTPAAIEAVMDLR
ncbi:MAG: hypothetical protein IT320_23175 [Anaerolineae bacterium]|nr:hypothetical protein [Anaerolineae bacterium]